MTPLRVTRHAIERAIEREPEIFSGSIEAVRVLVEAEVGAALDAGRSAKTKPRWAATGNRKKADRRARYVWNEQETRCWVVEVVRGLASVLTLLAPPEQEWIDRYEAKQGGPRPRTKP